MEQQKPITKEEAAREAMEIRAAYLALEERLGQLHLKMKRANLAQIDRFPAIMLSVSEVIPNLWKMSTDLIGSKQTLKLRGLVLKVGGLPAMIAEFRGR